jgi:hypothetical protein
MSFSTPRWPGQVSENALAMTLENVPIGTRFPSRIDRCTQRMDEGVHVAGVEVVFLVPGRGRQHDVGIHAGGGHAEIQRHQQIELALRRLTPLHLGRLLAAFLAQILALHAVRCPEQIFQEILVALAGGAEQVGAPHEQIAREIGRVIGVFEGEA